MLNWNFLITLIKQSLRLGHRELGTENLLSFEMNRLRRKIKVVSFVLTVKHRLSIHDRCSAQQK